MTASYPLSSQRAFNIFLTKALETVEVVGSQPDATSSNSASVTVSNTRVRTYILNSSSAQTLTIAKDLTNIKVGQTITVLVTGTGTATIVAASGVTINTLEGFNPKSNGRYSEIRLNKTGVNTWIISGNLETDG